MVSYSLLRTDDSSTLRNYFSYLRKHRLSDFLLVLRHRGLCQECGGLWKVKIVDLSPDGTDKINRRLLCEPCFRIVQGAKRWGMKPRIYREELKKIVAEILQKEVQELPLKRQKRKNNKRNVVRDGDIFRLHLLGRTHAHIASLFNLSRERVRQIIRRIK